MHPSPANLCGKTRCPVIRLSGHWCVRAIGLYYGQGELMRPHKLTMGFIYLSFAFCAVASPKDPPLQVINWPATGATVVRFSFGKFKEISSVGQRHMYTSDVTAENLWNKKISHAEFTLYVYD